VLTDGDGNPITAVDGDVISIVSSGGAISEGFPVTIR
jgi:hypothetical protein